MLFQVKAFLEIFTAIHLFVDCEPSKALHRRRLIVVFAVPAVVRRHEDQPILLRISIAGINGLDRLLNIGVGTLSKGSSAIWNGILILSVRRLSKPRSKAPPPAK